jgi:hypothetical protein
MYFYHVVLTAFLILLLDGVNSFPRCIKNQLRFGSLQMADVDIVFPNNKKTKAAVGSSLKDAAKKAGLIRCTFNYSFRNDIIILKGFRQTMDVRKGSVAHAN